MEQRRKRKSFKYSMFILIFALVYLTSCSAQPIASGSTTISSASEETTITTTSTSPTETTAVSSLESTTVQTTEELLDLVLIPPFETALPNTTYTPVTPDQTRAPGIVTSTPYTITLMTEALLSPWAVTTLPDGRLLITEKTGSLRIVSPEGSVSDPIGGFPVVDSRKQGGLLDVTLSPDYQNSRMLYFTLAEMTAEGSLTAVGRGRLADDEKSVEDFEIIWRAIPYYDNSYHFGSRLEFDSDGNIFVTTGERSDLATRPNAQLLDNGYGKVVHITPAGDPVPDNPFIGEDGILPEIYSYGHRNVQGLAIQPGTGDVWISEMGPRGGDELNLIEAGKNYGWPVISYGIEYSGDPIPGALTVMEGMEQPVYYWDPVLAPSGMTFYISDKIPEWQGNLFICGLKSQHISRIILTDGRVAAEEWLLAEEGQRFRDICEGADGSLYTITDSGRLYRIGI